MVWFPFIILSVLGTTIANIYRRVVMRDDRNDPLAFSVLFQFIGAFIVAIIAGMQGFVFPPIQQYPINFLLQAMLWGTATLCLFKASQRLEASETTIIMTLSSFVTIVSAIVFLAEGFGLNHLIGTILILSGVVLISMKSAKLRFNRGVAYALGFALFAGLGNTNDAYLVHHTHPLSYLAISFINPGLYLLIVQPNVITKMKPLFQGKAFVRIFFLTFFYAIGTVGFIWSIHLGANVSQISPINQSAIILTVLAAALFLKERDDMPRKLLSTILVFIGVILLS